MTIYENLIYENPEASIEEVENVCKICGIWDKLTQQRHSFVMGDNKCITKNG